MNSTIDRNKPSGMTRLMKAFGNSMKGFVGVYKNEAAFRQELLLAIVLVPLGFYLGHNGVERALLIGTVLLVLLVEILNSSIEAVVDRIGLERHELSGLAKDLGSAAVFLALVLVAVTWVLVLWR
ncbi:MAG TPA: diacylglycerol kinase [Steroidobacteraceae bacterium]|jgi:diacylglycerol kinase (ATP)|nr:diacylglycerol kinase [Steroidobacteraceae bacterium]